MDWNLRRYSKEEFSSAWLSSDSIAECASKLNLVKNGGTYKSLRLAAEDLGINEDHMKSNRVYANGKRVSKPLEEILVENSKVSSTSDLRVRLIKANILEPVCVGCNKTHAYNFVSGKEEPINFHLDHINGINNDNRLDNLRILCPTCHSFTTTYCGRNKSKREIIRLEEKSSDDIITKVTTVSKDRICSCGAVISAGSKQCTPCYRLATRKLNEYSDEELVVGVQTHGWLGYSKTIGVSDNGLRKIFDRRGIPRVSKNRAPDRI